MSAYIIPTNHADEWKPPGSPGAMFENLSKIRSELYKTYEGEFLDTLTHQATDLPSKYKPVSHAKIKVGDLVLIREDFLKRANLPLGRVLETTVNSLGEITEVIVLKGANGHRVRRHVSSIIPYLEVQDSNESNSEKETLSDDRSTRVVSNCGERPCRSAAKAAKARISSLAKAN